MFNKHIVKKLFESVKATYLFLSNRRVYQVIKRVLDDNLTYLPQTALFELSDSIAKLEKKHIDGAIIEAGCALGGSALVITTSKKKTRPFYLYDVFGMIPSPSEQDGLDVQERYEIIASGKSEGIGGNKYYGYEENLLQKVQQTFQAYNLPIADNNLRLVQGLFEDTLVVNEPVALAHLDCDWYESVMTCLHRIEPYLVKGGVLIIDDYYHWSGCRKAVDTYFADKRHEFDFIKKARLHIVRK